MISVPFTVLPAPAAGCDCLTCPFWAGPDGAGGPHTVEPLCSGTNSDCSYCGCSRAAGSSGCGQCPIRCGSRTDIQAWMADVGGTLAFDDIPRADLPTGLSLPAFIPQTDGSSITNLNTHLRWPAYGVGLRRIFSPDSHSLYPRWKGRPAAEALGLTTNQQAVLIGYGEDPLVEAMWTARRRDGLLDAIAAQGWDLVLAPNFSIYGNWPRAEHLINMRRCQIIATELLDRGVPAVVNAYWYRAEDLHRWVSWAHDVNAPAIAINLQTVRDTKGWDAWAEPGLHYLAAYLPATTTVVLTGLSRPDRIAAAVTLFGHRLVLVSQNPYQYALHGAVIGVTGRDDVHARVTDAFTASVRYMASLLPHATVRLGGS